MVLMVYFAGLVIASLWMYFSTTFIIAALGLGFLGLVTGLYHPAGLKMVSHSPNVSRFMGYHGVSGSLGLAAGPISLESTFAANVCSPLAPPTKSMR